MTLKHRRASLPVIAVLGLLAVAALPVWAGAGAQLPGQRLRVEVGPVEVMRGPDDVADNAFNTVAGVDGVLAYLANAETYGFSGPSLQALAPMGEPVLRGGAPPAFDWCGSWLNAAVRDGPVIRAWYHAEESCAYRTDPNNPATRKSIAYAESTDGGRTFVKPNYPNNLVISAPPNSAPGAGGDWGEGDHRVLRVGDYYYLYFVAARDYQVRLARSLVADGGRPGTWWKYYRPSQGAPGGFTEPGLGGQSSPIDPSGGLKSSWVSRSRTLGGFIGFSYVARDYVAGSKPFAGFGLTFSADGITGWSPPQYVVLPSEGEDFWGRGPGARELVAYPSMIGLDGDGETVGEEFWLYYTYVHPGKPLNGQRYLLRRRVRIVTAAGDTDIARVPRITLAQYRLGSDIWDTTVGSDPAYRYGKSLGAVFADRIANTIPLFDCYLVEQREHMVDIDPGCGNPAATQNLRRLGWVSTVPFEGAVRIYRCFDQQTLDHFVSPDPGCEGKSTEWPIGYLAPDPKFPAPVHAAPAPPAGGGYARLSRYYRHSADARLQDHWVTTRAPEPGYVLEGHLGSLWVDPPANGRAVYDCYLPNEADHMLDIDSGCGNPAATQNLGRLGYLSTEPVLGGVAIYRCHNDAILDHLVSTDPGCEGLRREWLMGYLAPLSASDGATPATPNPTPPPASPPTPSPAPSPTPTPVATVLLSRYFRGDADPQLHDHWATVAAIARPGPEYRLEFHLGYLWSSPPPNAVPIYDCYLPNEADHMLDIVPSCGSPTGARNLGLLGYASAVPVPGGVAIYRCHDDRIYDHLVSTDSNCEGIRKEWLIGYLLPIR